MKKLFLILFFSSVLSISSEAQNNLYLIFDENTPEITKDISKYKILNDPLVLTLRTKKYMNYKYYYSYPLLGGKSLFFEKKVGTIPQVLPMSALSSTYATALTIGQLDAQMQVLIDQDFDNPDCDLGANCATYQYFNNIDNFYIIELDHTNNQIIVVEATLDFSP